MAQALPIAKLAGLLVKTLAKPVSKRIKHDFSRSEFTKGILIFVGQTSHQLTSRLTIWSAGYKVRSIKPLEEEKALKEGAELIGETFILLVSGGVIVWEYNRSKEKDNAKNEEKRQQAKAERRALQAKLHALDVRVAALERVIQANRNSLLGSIIVGGEKYTPPPSDEVVPIDDDDDDDDDNTSKSSDEVSKVIETKNLENSNNTNTTNDKNGVNLLAGNVQQQSTIQTDTQVEAPPIATQQLTAAPPIEIVADEGQDANHVQSSWWKIWPFW